MNRISTIRANLLIAIAIVAACAAVKAQVEPAAFGSAAKLNYDLSYTQTASFYSGYNGTQQRGTASGEVDYSNGKPHRPMGLTYSGGYLFGINGVQGQTGLFQHLKFSQGYFKRKWGVNVSDNVSYSPQTPVGGFSGIPGVGILPGQPDGPLGAIVYSRVFYNVADATFNQSLNHNTNVSFDANYTNLRYPDGAALETNNLGLRPQIEWRLNGRNSASVQYTYSSFSYVGSSFKLETQALQPGIFRIWNRRLSTGVSAGPEWIRSNSLFLPPSTGVAVSAWVTYETQFISASARYSRQSSTGVGYGSQIGVHNDDAAVGASHVFGRNLTLGLNASYIRAKGLLQSGVTTGEFGTFSATRQVSDFLSISTSYTALEQRSSLSLPTNALTGMDQVISFNVAYHPREGHIFKK